jgi:ribosomal protein L11 methyltransferase
MPVSPYQDLYIYYLSGHIPPDGNYGTDFIGNWQEEDSSFLFFSSPARRQVDALIADQPGVILVDEYRMSYDQWQGGCIKPLHVGRLNIIPPWISLPGSVESEAKIDILLDPGVVFGNGLHPTTHDSLMALQKLWDRTAPVTVFDLGTGTGVLALAAARLGARHVLAVDLNHLAVKTTQANLCRNQLQQQVLAVQGRAEDFIDCETDLLIANIHFDVMKRLVAAPGFTVKPWSILSGLLRSEARMIADQLNRQGASIVHSWEHEGTWHTFLVRSG